MSEPQRPADAYYELVAIFGEAFFQTQPPSQGTEVTLVGKDGVEVFWSMTDAQAMWLNPMVHANKNLRWVTARRYPTGAGV